MYTNPENTWLQTNIAYNILINPSKRAQYDRDRLDYLYTHCSSHKSFHSPPAPSPQTDTTTDTAPFLLHRDKQIQIYTTALTDRIIDPFTAKKKTISSRLARTRHELDEFNDTSAKHRQDWATSSNRILRMAANALREIVVRVEEDLCMLEDELGRLDGVLAPPQGEDDAWCDLGGGGVAVRQRELEADLARHFDLAAAVASQSPLSLPPSPTVPIQTLSASKSGIQGEDSSNKEEEDSSDREGNRAVRTVTMADDRVHKFLLGPANAPSASHIQPIVAGGKKANTETAGTSIITRDNKPKQPVVDQHVPPFKVFVRDVSLPETLTSTTNKANMSSPSASVLDKAFSQRPIGMGLVEWQALHGTLSATPAVRTKMQTLGASCPKENGKHSQGHFAKRDEAVTSTTYNLTSTTTDNGIHSGGKISNTTTMTTASNHFSLHVSQTSKRAIPPASVADTAQARSAGIKDFQVRVWSAAKAAKKSGSEPLALKDGNNNNIDHHHHHHTSVFHAAALPPSDAGLGDPDCRRVSPSKDHEPAAAAKLSVFRRSKSSRAPTPSGDEELRNHDITATVVLDDPFR